MNRIFITICTVILALGASARTAVTLEQCVEAARENYPLIAKYQLLTATQQLSIDEINTAWLPRVAVSGQASWQSAVPTFPAAFSGMMAQMGGTQLKGIPHWQYRAGVEASQTVYDGGATAQRAAVERSQTAVQRAAVDVDMYAVRQRVENLYFAVLLMQQQIEQTELTHNLLTANLQRVQALVRGGAALQADADMIEAQALTLAQQITNAQAVMDGYREALALLCNMGLKDAELQLPDVNEPVANDINRPEFALLEARGKAVEAAQQLSNTAVLPKVGVFAQGFYGMPGLDNFRSMTDRTPTLNFIGGVKISWNIDSYYTLNSQRKRSRLSLQTIEADRDALSRSIGVQSAQRRAVIEGIRRMKRSDERIVELRSNVRRAAEAQLANGVLDATGLLGKITDENIAAMNARYHQIQLIQEIYRLKYILNQ